MALLANSNLPDFGFTKGTDHHPKSNLLQGFLSSVDKRQLRIMKEDTTLSIADER
ncbi:unnamed protein product, partial [Rotaria sp. Silwood2]